MSHMLVSTCLEVIVSDLKRKKKFKLLYIDGWFQGYKSDFHIIRNGFVLKVTLKLPNY